MMRTLRRGHSRTPVEITGLRSRVPPFPAGCAVALMLAGAVPPADLFAQASQRFALDNDVRVVFFPVPESPQLVISAYVPLDYLECGPQQVGWTHLVARLLRPSLATGVAGAVGSEALFDLIHVDISGPPTAYKDLIDRHAAWMSAPAFTDAVVRQHIDLAIADIDENVKKGRTDRYTLTVWASALRDGVAAFDIKRSIRSAGAAELSRFCRERLLDGKPPVLAVLGTFSQDPVLNLMQERIGSIRRPAGAASSAPASQASVPTTRPAPSPAAVPDKVRWDLPRSHVLFYWPLPELSFDDRSALLTAETHIQIGWAAEGGDHLPAGTTIQVAGLIQVAGQSYFVIDVPLRDDKPETLANARAASERVIAPLQQDPMSPRVQARADFAGPAIQLRNLPKVIEGAVSRGMDRRRVEFDLAVLLGRLDFRYEGQLSRHVDATMGAREDVEVQSLMIKTFAPIKRRELLIAPGSR